ncbi:cytochrome b561 [Zafaria cholistanensis]|uniref:Cytochrome b561 n=1 Tax=Zafaria cholistanensis TaxID=1682741 RepID=A0A5A7NM52_9MICC|nr:COX15/CtaA family protein [Zafaria cholistanensis]GER22033.1 cytochrome b561 [Zafaria cholistanensis]
MTTAPAPLARLAARLPARITPAVHRLAVASLVSEVAIIITGGAVRLTKSGLGCAEWPNCMPGTMTPTAEMGIHGLIEFGNRMLTFVLAAVAVAMLASVWRGRKEHRTVFALAAALLAGIPLQAVIGGITVWTDLNPWVVSLHFLASSLMVCAATLMVNRTGRVVRGEGPLAAPHLAGSQRSLGWAVLVASAAAICLGTIVTGTGPHAGDAAAPRHGFDALLVTRLHAMPVYLLVAATALALFLAFRAPAPAGLRRALLLLAAVLVLQAGIGYWQHFTGLPVVLVLAHMLGAALLAAAATNAWDRSTGRFPL